MSALPLTTALAVFSAGLLLAEPVQSKSCPRDSVQVGRLCVDKYEASVWEIPPARKGLIENLRQGRITSAASLTRATQRGVTSDDYGVGCPGTGSGCKSFYAVSIPAVTPSAYITWFQALAACRNAGKRLLTNAEWQAAALGTPVAETDDGAADCNLASATFTVPEDPTPTGSRSGCVSDVGAFDMAGNLWEWVADWTEVAAGCTNWDEAHGNDLSCVGGNGMRHLPGALLRGGSFDGRRAGVFAVNAVFDPSSAFFAFGFRCGREL